MDAQARIGFTELVENSIITESGLREIERAKSMLLADLERGRFNSARAEEIFRMAIDRAVWKNHGSLGAATTMAIRDEGIIEDIAVRFRNDFKESTGAHDQRPARKGFLSKLLGK